VGVLLWGYVFFELLIYLSKPMKPFKLPLLINASSHKAQILRYACGLPCTCSLVWSIHDTILCLRSDSFSWCRNGCDDVCVFVSKGRLVLGLY
jgi:hypothetical protein